MSPFQIVLQAAICGAIIIGALAMLAAHWIHDALNPSIAAMVGIALDGPSNCTAYDPVRAGTAEPCHCCECTDCAGCPTCDAREALDDDNQDPGDEWDRARDRDLDYRRGVA